MTSTTTTYPVHIELDRNRPDFDFYAAMDDHRSADAMMDADGSILFEGIRYIPKGYIDEYGEALALGEGQGRSASEWVVTYVHVRSAKAAEVADVRGWLWKAAEDAE